MVAEIVKREYNSTAVISFRYIILGTSEVLQTATHLTAAIY